MSSPNTLISTNNKAWQQYLYEWRHSLSKGNNVLRCYVGYRNPEVFLVEKVTDKRICISNGEKYHKSNGYQVLGVNGFYDSYDIVPVDTDLEARRKRVELLDLVGRLTHWWDLETPELEQVWEIVKHLHPSDNPSIYSKKNISTN